MLTDADIPLLVEKGIRGRICLSINKYEKGNNKYMKAFDKNKESSYIKYWNVNNFYGWAMSQKLPVNDFKWVKYIPEFVINDMKWWSIFSWNWHPIPRKFT